MEKRSHGMDWLRKGRWYSPEKLDNKLLKNVQDIRQSYKVYHGSHKKMEMEIDRWRKNFN